MTDDLPPHIQREYDRIGRIVSAAGAKAGIEGDDPLMGRSTARPLRRRSGMQALFLAAIKKARER